MASQSDVKKSLIKQLKDKGADVDHFVSLVDDYMWCWKQVRTMQKDIKERGQQYTTFSAAGHEYEKDNPSVKNAVMYSKQMLAILKDLGLSTDNVIAEKEDGDIEL